MIRFVTEPHYLVGKLKVVKRTDVCSPLTDEEGLHAKDVVGVSGRMCSFSGH